MMRVADLHLHTCYSDGSRTPAELVVAARETALAAIAVTDHDTMAGVCAGVAAGVAHRVEVIAGVEITCELDAREVHMLGYFFGDDWRRASLQGALAQAGRVREQRAVEFVRKLNALGIGLTAADVRACSATGTVGRPHVAQALVNRGHVRTVEEAFERFLRRGKPGFVERYRMSAREAIDQVRRAGGVAVLAHPGLYRIDPKLRELVDQGLGGLEVWHPKHSPAQRDHYRAVAEKLGLVVTGGSDDHGPGRDSLLGTVKLPYHFVEALRGATCQTP